MAIFDVEAFRDYYLALFKANLNTKITAINAEKSDTIELKTFADDQYVSDLNEKVLNYTEFVDHGITDIEVIPNDNHGFALNITMFFIVVFSEPEGGGLSDTTMMRYTRALQEVALDDIGKNPSIQSIAVKPFAPIDMKDTLTSKVVKIGAIEITGTVG